MLWVNIKRVMWAGFVSFWRNGFVSLASVLVMTVTLFVIGLVIFILATLDASLSDLKSRVDVNVYMTVSATEADTLSLKKSISGLPEVKEVKYISRAEALDNFRKRHENNQANLDALAELQDNPFPAVLNVSAKDPSQYEAIAGFLRGDNALSKDKRVIISKVNYEDNKTAISVLTKIITSAQKLGSVATIVLVIISILIIFNTIRLAIYTSREEISVMRLVGASNKYIRGPFMISGIMYGVVAGLITLGIFYPITYWLGTETANFFNGINIYNYYIVNFGQIFGIIMGSGVVLGALSSYLSVRKHLTL
ncbi:MAG: ABC transporter permease [Candidatus Taylorbacteria bacterium]|nr:ABC transporter permease [Candidatus Taylorbacteria bacterium]